MKRLILIFFIILLFILSKPVSGQPYIPIPTPEHIETSSVYLTLNTISIYACTHPNCPIKGIVPKGEILSLYDYTVRDNGLLWRQWADSNYFVINVNLKYLRAFEGE